MIDNYLHELYIMDSFVNMMRIDTNEILRYYSYKSKWNLLCEISFKISSSHYRNTFDGIIHINLNGTYYVRFLLNSQVHIIETHLTCV